MIEATLPRRAALRHDTLLIAVSYATIAAVLLWSRLAGLDGSLWHDEIFTEPHVCETRPVSDLWQ